MRMSSLPSFDGCEVAEKVAAGPIVEVYRATQVPLGRKVTIKALAPSVVPSSPFALALEREARLLGQLSHPNIIGLYDFVRKGDRLWLVLEAIDGWSLVELLDRAKRFSHPAAAGIARLLAQGLAHAHARGIVHRDVRPANVMLSKAGGVKLTDFSVASDERLPTAPELLDGSGGQPSLAYASPEQVLGEPPDPRSDLFSLGALLYELIAGMTPFGPADDPGATLRIRNEPPPPLGRYAPDLAPTLERVVQRCLQKMPAHRYQSAEELGVALDAALADMGVSPRDAVLEALSGLGLAVKPSSPVITVRVPRRAGPSLTNVAAVLLGFSFLLGAGGGAIELWARRSGSANGEAGPSGRLELVPATPGYLRVVAQPWAQVIVDGETFDTTPFARAIPLSPGTHYVRLEHPQAPTERRTIELSAGETILLDVSMKIRRPAGLSHDDGASSAAPVDSSP
jgi:eukaryotic-like serine/threonine-protein kinase